MKIVNKILKKSKCLLNKYGEAEKSQNVEHNQASELENPDFFEASSNKLTNVLKDAASKGFDNPEAVAAALGALSEVANETVKFVAEQETLQEEIRAKRDVAIAQINATSQLIKKYLDKTFDERSAIFAKQFDCVDAALKNGNVEMLSTILNSINALAAQSPFKALANINEVQKALASGDTEWDI